MIQDLQGSVPVPFLCTNTLELYKEVNSRYKVVNLLRMQRQQNTSIQESDNEFEKKFRNEDMIGQ